MTRDIVLRAKRYEQDTIPGDFGVLQAPCPKCGSEVHEKYRNFACLKCEFTLPKILAGRLFENEEAEALITQKQLGPVQGFRSRMGKPFGAVLKLSPEFRVEFDFGNDQPKEDGTAAAVVDFTGKEPLGKCPKCGAGVFDNGMNYLCEKATGAGKTCDFRTGALILQQQIEPAQVKKLLETGKTDLLKAFVSKRTGRKFEAFLVWKDGKVGFEFAPRQGRDGAKAAKSKEPPPKLDFTGQPPLGKCLKCGGAIFEGPLSYVCEHSQATTKRCAFKVSKAILQQPVEPAQLAKLLTTRKTDLLTKFVSAKTGKPFSAYLVMDDKGKVTFDFPPRE